MSQTTSAEEYDPATGTFRPIKRAATAAKRATRKAAAPERKTKAAQVAGLSDSGQKYGVFYEVFEHAAMSTGGTILVRVSQVVIAIIFALLLYEAISYRIAQGL